MPMTGWKSEELAKIGTAEELKIASMRRDDTLRKPVTIWVVRQGDVSRHPGALGVWHIESRNRLGVPEAGRDRW